MREKKSPGLKEAREKAVRLRLKAMQSQLAAALNLCLTAGNALGLGEHQLARTAIEKVRHVIEVIRVHVDEPGHVPEDAMASIRHQAAELERQMCSLEERLRR
jgi:hypothetical protein